MVKSARQIALEILLKIEKADAYSNIAIDSAVKMYNPDSTDCAFISRLVYGVIERKLTLDYALSQNLDKPLNKLKKDVLTILRLGAYQILYLDKIPHSAAVNESVKLTKDNKCSYASGLVNAVLRKISQKELAFDEIADEKERLSVMYSAPVELVSLLTHHYGRDNAESFLKASLEPKKLYIKVNTVKTTTNELREALEAEGVSCKATSLPDSLEIDVNTAVYNLEAFKKGLFHIEDLASQYCASALDVYEGCVVIDTCAAPGGKSFAIAEKMNNKGKVYSCDIYSARTGLIEQGAERLGLDCIEPFVNDASVYNEKFPLADRVLCDVPCSGLGIIGKKPEIKYKKLDEAKSLIPLQKQILEASSRYVKKGGRLVYSTCSVNPGENRKVCDAFLSEHKEFKSVRVLEDLPRTVDEGDYITLFPHTNECDGFFIAAFIKTEDVK